MSLENVLGNTYFLLHFGIFGSVKRKFTFRLNQVQVAVTPPPGISYEGVLLSDFRRIWNYCRSFKSSSIAHLFKPAITLPITLMCDEKGGTNISAGK